MPLREKHRGEKKNMASKEDHTSIKIPVFDGENYSMWKKITLYLKLKKCEETITRKKVTADKEDWDEKDLKAMNYIYSGISDI